MVLDATIASVRFNDDGTATLILEAAGSPLPPGHTMLTVTNPPDKGLDAAIGCHLKAKSQYGPVTMNGVRWAERVGFARVSLVRTRKKVVNAG